ncbi:hypothetical protein KC909_01910 [Candidatus Dojkabacteria bacterium]|uniref:Uncharacterized protein n=1 Tax=Candidatus Dojkabacteria bacterium TaxID=2099670 RepID=A0A955RIT7_9BACT|nr:hypothetical protein [Candidatus Dojkabacteria bacterium]
MSNEGRFHAVEEASRAAHRSPEALYQLQLTINDHFATRHYLYPDAQVEWRPYAIPGRPGYFSEAKAPETLRLGIPDITPDFVNLSAFLGPFQALNSKPFMRYILELGGHSVHDIAIASGVPADFDRPDEAFLDFFVRTQRGFLEATYVLGAATTIYGAELDNVTASFDRTYRLYPHLVNSSFEFPDGVVTDQHELRQRLVDYFGDWDQQGIFFTHIAQDMQGCPGILITDDICRSIGYFMEQDENWDRFAANAFHWA